MKRFLILLSAAFALTQCSTEPEVVPVSPEEDMKTSATLYADQFLTINVTTRTYDIGEPPLPVYFFLSGNAGEIKVNWGDGSTSHEVIGSDRTRIEHDYAEEKSYTIQISGDIKAITSFGTTSYSYYDVNSVHFGGLVNLQNIDMNFLQSPGVINLSRNRELRYISLMGLYGTKDLLLPSTNKINYLRITGATGLPTAVIDRVIARVYDSVLKSPRPGSINVSADGFWEDEPSEVFLGPPSSWSINKLRTLQNKYQWTVTPKIQ